MKQKRRTELCKLSVKYSENHSDDCISQSQICVSFAHGIFLKKGGGCHIPVYASGRCLILRILSAGSPVQRNRPNRRRSYDSENNGLCVDNLHDLISDQDSVYMLAGEVKSFFGQH